LAQLSNQPSRDIYATTSPYFSPRELPQAAA
jgi:hypothetical protein